MILGDWWSGLLLDIVTMGRPAGPRGKRTRELIGVHAKVDATRNIIAHPLRDLNYRFLVSEWLWILLGRNDLKTVARFNSKMAEFSDDGFTLSGAYGPPFAAQLPYVVGKLKDDRESRQAVMTLWRPDPEPSKDQPCTVSLQYLIRNNEITVVASMRSSDAWLGLPYDAFVFTQLANWVRALVDPSIEMGRLILSLGSSHLYEDDIERARAVALADELVESIASPLLTAPFPSIVEDALVHAAHVRLSGACPGPWERYYNVLTCAGKVEALGMLRRES